MDGGSLEGKPISFEPALVELACTLDHLRPPLADHGSFQFFSREIKPSNLLLNYHKHVKIADFGISQILSQTMDPSNSSVGTITYMIPGRINIDLNHGRYDSYTGDIWILRVRILEFYLGRFPFFVSRQGDWASMMCAICMVPPTTSREFSDFISHC